jgi:hypothetical protein
MFEDEEEGDVAWLVDDGVFRGSSSRTGARRLPVRWGLLPFQGDKRSSCDDAPLTASWCRRGRLAEGLGCNLFVFVDLSVIFPVNISFFHCKKNAPLCYDFKKKTPLLFANNIDCC